MKRFTYEAANVVYILQRSNNSVSFYRNGRVHRENGPAICYTCYPYHCYYYLNSRILTKEEHAVKARP